MISVFELSEMRCLELFARNKINKYFDLWGDEVPNYFKPASKDTEEEIG